MCFGVGFGRGTGSHSVQLLFSYRNLNDDIIPQVGALEVTANIVFGYATWVPSHHPLAQALGLSLPAQLRGSDPHSCIPPPLMLEGLGKQQPPVPHRAGSCPWHCLLWAASAGMKLQDSSRALGFGLMML